jgi:hypothetical protein
VSRQGRCLRRWAATALLLVVALTWLPQAHAAGGGSLTRQYPLGTQTLCCQAGSGHSGTGSTTKGSSTPRTTSATRPTRGHGGVSILLVVAIVVIAFAPAVFILRAGFSARRRALRHDPHPEPDGTSSPELEPAPDDGAPPGVSRETTAPPS